MTDRISLSKLTVLAGNVVLLEGISLQLEAGQIMALVGSSGSGKTLTAKALLGLVDIDPGVTRAELEIWVQGKTLRPYHPHIGKGPRARTRDFRSIRGDIIGYMPQDARAALDPLWTVGRQVTTVAKVSGGGNALAWLKRAGFANPDRIAGLYPHELSGGMAQRAVIAQALARGSRFLLADEPTSGLDPTVQGEILKELRGLADEGIGVLLITHDLRILPSLAHEVIVVDRGRVAERISPTALRENAFSSKATLRLVEATRKIAGGRLG